MNQDIISEPIEFEWDKGNKDKNFRKHGVSNEEAEEIFLNDPFISEDPKHSKIEKRYQGLGETGRGRKLFISFTLRDSRVRIISARNMSKKERRVYEQKIKNNT